MRIVVDTNVLLSAALRDRLPERVVLHVATHDDWQWLVSAEILDEYVGVLKRPKFALPPEVLQRWIDLIQARTICVTSPPAVNFARDPKDAPILSVAMATSADYLISGDRDLLQAQSLVQTHIVPTAEFAVLFGIT